STRVLAEDRVAEKAHGALAVRVEPPAAGTRAAVDVERLPVEERTCVGCEEEAGAYKLPWKPRPLERNAVQDPAAQIVVRPDWSGQRRVHESRRDRIRADA